MVVALIHDTRLTSESRLLASECPASSKWLDTWQVLGKIKKGLSSGWNVARRLCRSRCTRDLSDSGVANAGEVFMSWSILQIVLYLAVLGMSVKPLGFYMARALSEPSEAEGSKWRSAERWFLKFTGVDPDSEMTAKTYAIAVLVFSLVSFLFVFTIQRVQASLPLNPAGLPNVSVDSAFNTAISFVTNTNWQGYGGESTMSYLTQMLALTVQNFVSAAVGVAVLVALIRGFVRSDSSTIGNFYVDVTRAVFYVLLPLSFVIAIVLVSQGVVQTFAEYAKFSPVEPITVVQSSDEALVPTQIALGPVASQVAIKQLGTNGGGFFNANSAHPFENPTPLSNFIQALAILILPASLCYTFGVMVNDRRQGWALLAAMSLLFVPLLLCTFACEQVGNPRLGSLGIDQSVGALQAGGNMEGKETRFGIVNSAIWAVATTAASNGSVNAMHDSFTPLGGLVPLWLMQLGEVIFGGVGSGLYGMLVFAMVTVFIAGLMVGRTPEYLGKKINAFEMKMVSLAILLPCASVLIGTAISVLVTSGKASIFNPGPHGFSEVLYAWSSASNNNGSAFAGLGANTMFYNTLLGVAMLIGRFGVILPVLAIAGSLAAKKTVPAGAGTLPTHTPLFVVLLLTIVILVGALSFLPALALGPIAEQLLMISN